LTFISKIVHKYPGVHKINVRSELGSFDVLDFTNFERSQLFLAQFLNVFIRWPLVDLSIGIIVTSYKIWCHHNGFNKVLFIIYCLLEL
jgi:hypothetical protein